MYIKFNDSEAGKDALIAKHSNNFFLIFSLFFSYNYSYTTVLTLFTLKYLRYLQNNIVTTVLTNRILKLLIKQFLHNLQYSDYTTTDKLIAPILFCYSTNTEIHRFTDQKFDFINILLAIGSRLKFKVHTIHS